MEITKADFSLNACIKEVKYLVEKRGENPYKLLGEFVVRAETDIFFNKTMVEATKEYIRQERLSC